MRRGPWPPGARGTRVRARCYRVQPAARGARGRTDRESVHPVRWRRPGATDGVPYLRRLVQLVDLCDRLGLEVFTWGPSFPDIRRLHPTFSRLRFRGRPLSLSDWAAWSDPVHEARSHHRARVLACDRDRRGFNTRCRPPRSRADKLPAARVPPRGNDSSNLAVARHSGSAVQMSRRPTLRVHPFQVVPSVSAFRTAGPNFSGSVWLVLQGQWGSGAEPPSKFVFSH